MKRKSIFLLPGRWHAVTRDQASSLAELLAELGEGLLVFVITACDKSATKRHPLALAERRLLVEGLAASLGRQCEIYAVPDISDSQVWVSHLLDSLDRQSEQRLDLDKESLTVISANPEVSELFQVAGFTCRAPSAQGVLPVDLLGAIAAGANWKDIATVETVAIYERGNIPELVREIFRDVLLNEDGELSTGRDYAVYGQGMDASTDIKETDIFPYVLPGRIVDKGCGTGSLLVRLSAAFPDSEIIGMDLSRELLRTSEGKHYPNHNVAVVRGNIIENRFEPKSLSTVILGSVMHEIYSYNGYDREAILKTLANTRLELETGGRIIIRDGVKPDYDGKVWMRCTPETEAVFRRFAVDFKKKSPNPGVTFTEQMIDAQRWFYLGMHEANEFLSKKDYLANWDMEVNEEFGVYTRSEWERVLEDMSFRVVECRTYLNSWIEENRYRGQVWLHADNGGFPGEALPYPDTTMVLVGEAVFYGGWAPAL